MNKILKNIILLGFVIFIVASIWYLESQKPRQISSQPQDLALPSVAVNGTSDAISTASTTTPTTVSKANRAQIQKDKAKKYERAKELVGIKGYINSGPFKLADLIGKKVILIDFWTYSCINCARAAPYVNAWYGKYKDKGLVIVGVHTPEFDFEKVYDNVAKAVKEKYGIRYPVVLDSDYGTWNAYGNRFWPREYLIDIDGYIVHDHIGEGGYDETERAIQSALKERDVALGLSETIDMSISSPQGLISMDASKVGSPETYFGSARNDYLANGTPGIPGSQTLTIPTDIQPNKLYLGGTWNFSPEYAENSSDTATITYAYNTKNVYFVASSEKGVKIKIFRDGKPLVGSEAGSDVSTDGTVFIKDNRLYDIVKGADYGKHTLEMQVEGAGLNAFTFTFG